MAACLLSASTATVRFNFICNDIGDSLEPIVFLLVTCWHRRERVIDKEKWVRKEQFTFCIKY